MESEYLGATNGEFYIGKKVKWRKQYKFKWEDITILKGVTSYFAVLVWRK